MLLWSAERLITRLARGWPVLRSERKLGQRCEASDCAVYATAAKAALSLSEAAFAPREDALRAPMPDKPAPPPVIRSQWMDRGRRRY